MNIQYKIVSIRNILKKNISMINKVKYVKWKDGVDKYCLAEKGLLNDVDVPNSKLEKIHSEKIDLMEKGLIENDTKSNAIMKNIKKYDIYGTENFIEEKMYYSNDSKI